MKSLKKLVTLAISMTMVSSIFTGCSYEGKSLSDAFTKTQKATSSEFKTQIGLRFNAENLSAEEQQEIGKAIPMINASKLTMNGKMNQSNNGKSGKMQADMAVQVGNMPINMGLWIDTNTANDKVDFKEILKMPDAQSSKMNGKQYIVLDSSNINENGAVGADLAKTSQDMQKKLSELTIKSMASFDPKFKLITDEGTQYWNLADGARNVHVYEIKLNDKNFKDLIKYTSNSIVNSKETKDFLKDYLTTVTKVSADKGQAATTQAEIDKSFSDFEKGLPQFTTNMNKVLNAFDGVTLVGDKGIVIDYAVDSNGYIVGEKGNIDLVFDSPKFMSVVQDLSNTKNNNAANKLTGIYKLGIDFNTSIFNINKNVEIKFPEINSQNSIRYEDLISQNKIK
ncbi:hypothetical protein HBE96_02575 [Clostridium sp. P21]|uniref:Lipoprotein n=1 Tax=Clostridium muellerianum TaxID=2716538 RepID=A0A7Y0EDX5_9CLOT|nr:hypothetical protein [Clostridium muellerianum]NMM61596.1 hypothetical protein [Clostridium muellerianum]